MIGAGRGVAGTAERGVAGAADLGEARASDLGGADSPPACPRPAWRCGVAWLAWLAATIAIAIVFGHGLG
jgi:hypothetical protein